MDIFYSTYQLTPLKRANRLSSLDPKQGVYLRAKIDGAHAYADYFPHLPLGDRSVEQFLSEFNQQKVEYDQKLLTILLNDPGYQNKAIVPFRNHQLWSGSEPLIGDVIKYKLLSPQDFSFLAALERGIKVRLDANGMFSRSSYSIFMRQIPEKYYHLIDYVEDPILDQDWSALGSPTARDFLSSNCCDYYIYKPNCEFRPDGNEKLIYSAYLGSELGSWHTYCELVDSGDLSTVHGIIGEGFYQEERGLFKGNYRQEMQPDQNVVKNIYQELELRSWKRLCTI